MVGKAPKFPKARASHDGVQCDRCAMEFLVAAADADSIWIVCPDCGVRFWHAAGSARVAIADAQEGRAHWGR